MHSRMSSPVGGLEFGEHGSFYSYPSTADSEGRAHSLRRGRRSPSPTEYFKHRHTRTDQMESIMHELNQFNHQAIDKFLDKQAVYNLISEYNEDKMFGAEFWEVSDSDSGKEVPTYANLLQTNRKADIDKARASFNNQLAQNKRKKSWVDLFLGLIHFKIFTVNHVHRRNLSLNPDLAEFN